MYGKKFVPLEVILLNFKFTIYNLLFNLMFLVYEKKSIFL